MKKKNMRNEFPKEKMEKVDTTEQLMPLGEIADKLDAMQSAKNEGRGVRCVQDIILYLRRGDLRSARQVAHTDHDKINDALGLNADIKEFIKTELFRGEKEHPWSVLERWEEQKKKRKV